MSEKDNKKNKKATEAAESAAKEAAPKAAESAAEAAETTEDTYTVTKAQMEQMEALAKTLADANDKYLRLAAEYDNYRKRTAREKEHLYNDAKIDTIKPFLAVLDNLERGVSQFEEGDGHRQGMEQICKQFSEVAFLFFVKTILRRHFLGSLVADGNIQIGLCDRAFSFHDITVSVIGFGNNCFGLALCSGRYLIHLPKDVF